MTSSQILQVLQAVGLMVSPFLILAVIGLFIKHPYHKKR